MNNPINFLEKFSKFEDHWSPKVIAEMNDYQFKLVKIKGEFVTHNHEDTDEVFIVIEGLMKIHYEDRVIELKSGEMVVVKKGEKHRPYAEEECKIMLVEPIGTVNTGDVGGELTALNNEWI
jgi:mannose-6-phosphate isomerase-like protein (cupin superfamily)|tara:strand:- start:156 stop:518 length:363 start_codon:yes stop_codon:yes gene_type:complete